MSEKKRREGKGRVYRRFHEERKIRKIRTAQWEERVPGNKEKGCNEGKEGSNEGNTERNKEGNRETKEEQNGCRYG